jgi:hypothetical protein
MGDAVAGRVVELGTDPLGVSGDEAASDAVPPRPRA